MRIENKPTAAALEHSAPSLLALFGLTLPILLAGVFLVSHSKLLHVFTIAEWFDPLFFQYNVLLWMTFVLLIPCITYFYVRNMREEREGRLKSELRPETWQQLEGYIKSVIRRQFGMPNYIGSTATLMVVVAMGLAILFLLKPIITGSHGLNYSLGANLFLMGTDMALDPMGADSRKYFDRVVVSLTAFQFGFLGAYVYFIRHLVRSYFTMDLTPNTFVAMSVRMVTAGLVALVLSFSLPALDAPNAQWYRALLPIVSFGIGFFPDWGLLAIEKATRRVLHLPRTAASSLTPLSELSGMSYEHEARLNRQGYDSVENVADANLVEMALRTGFSYAQLRTWVGEAWLRARFGREDFPKLVQLTGIRTADQFKAVFADAKNETATAVLADAGAAAMKTKLQSVARLVRDWNPEGRAIASATAAEAAG